MRKAVFLTKYLLLFFVLTGLVTVGFYQVSAQSQALNGQIEGVITDANGAALPNVTITARNTQTGTERKTTTDESGVYRFPLLPLGNYQMTVEAASFKRLVRDGITLTTGQNATVDMSLEIGGLEDTVTITSDAPIADPGKIDVGRVMNAREVQNLPLVSRNPYNYSLLQANVTGRPNAEFGVPRINANGYARRTNYQLDGNSNTQADRAGIRLMPISETFVSEVQLVTNGFSAEFGNTPGLIMNAITPTGTNGFHGSASYRFRRTGFTSRLFNTPPTSIKPETKVDNFTGAVGGPIIKDKWHFYTGYEWIKRDLAGEPQRTISINAANQAALIAAGVPSSAFPTAIPASQKVNFFIFRTDAQLSDDHRLTGRYNYFKNISPNNIGGGITTLERSIDFNDISYSVGLQLASVFTTDILNEFRFQYAKRDSRNLANDNSGSGPSIVISGIANFGAPENANTIAPLETMTQFQDNVTWTFGDHAIKIGAGLNKIDDTRRSGIFSRYTFASIAAYAAARNGTNPRGYTQYVEAFGDPNIDYKSTFYNFFAQDDWKVTRRLKFNYGLRYDLYDISNANPDAPFEASRNFKVDRNNVAPRLGIVYALREGKLPTVLRASAGLYYDTPYLDMYLRALQNSGSPRFFNFTFGPVATPTRPAGPAFPDNFGSLPPGAALPRQSIDTISSDFKVMYAMHSNVQVEQAITNDLSFTLGYIHSNGRHIPVYRNINCLPTGETLPDGRPIYGTASVNMTPGPNAGVVSISGCTNGIFSQFQNILMAESVGNSNYDAGTFQLSKRFSRGYQFSVNYTLSRSKDDAPEQNLVAASSLVQSDPSNRELDRSLSLADQTHTFVLSFVGRPQFSFENKAINYILNNNQIGVIATANNGEIFNITTNLDINRDGVLGSDRPVGIERNSGRTPRQVNVDVRFSRFIPITERFRIEAFAEAVNIFNTNSIFQFNNTVLQSNRNALPGTTGSFDTLVNPLTGELRGSLPDFRSLGVTSLDSRQFQFGFKFIF
ncbi:MAG: TonB-dependent receptor [Pyrinomonadaceae bacterium]